MGLTKPPKIEGDAFKSAKWDELTEGRSFEQSDAPALATMKQASAEIRALNKQLGINDERKGEGDGGRSGASALNIVSFNREKRRAAAQA